MEILDTAFHFGQNVRRIKNLIKIFEDRGNSSSVKSLDDDLLRAGVVLLHAALEDFIRSLRKNIIPQIGGKALYDIPFRFGNKKVDKIALSDLFVHKDKLVGDLIKSNISKSLDKESYSNPKDIVNAILEMELSVTEDIKKLLPPISEMISRRHKIVHQADKSEDSSISNYSQNTISLVQVNGWVVKVEKLVLAIADQIQPPYLKGEFQVLKVENSKFKINLLHRSRLVILTSRLFDTSDEASEVIELIRTLSLQQGGKGLEVECTEDGGYRIILKDSDDSILVFSQNFDSLPFVKLLIKSIIAISIRYNSNNL